MAARRPFGSLRDITLRVAGTRIERWNLLMPKFGGRTRAISVGGAVLAGLAGVVGVVIFASPAGAWSITDFQVSGSACATTTGTYTVTYVGKTGAGDNGTLTVESETPSGTTISGSPQEVTGGKDFTVTQSGIPGSATSASVTIKLNWHGDDNPATQLAEAKLSGDCNKPPTQVTATEPTFSDATCLSPQPTYTIPPATGVQYEVNGKPVDSNKTYDAQPGDVVAVTAVAVTDYTLTGATSWGPHTFAAVPTNCANVPTVTQPSCSSPNGSYMIPTTADVVYYVNGKEAKADTYSSKPGSTVKITAFGSQGQALPGTTSWTFTIRAAPTDCNAHVPTFVDNTCTVSGTYTIPATTADYTVNDVSVAPGKHSATAGAVVTVKAIAAAGHPLSGTTSWTHTFPTLPQCAPAAANNGSGPLAQTGPEVPVGQASLIAGLLALVGGAMLYAGRRRPAVGPGRHSAP